MPFNFFEVYFLEHYPPISPSYAKLIMINPEELQNLQKFWCNFGAASAQVSASSADTTPPPPTLPTIPPNMEHLNKLWAFMLQASNGNPATSGIPTGAFFPGAGGPMLPGAMPNAALLGLNVEQVGNFLKNEIIRIS